MKPSVLVGLALAAVIIAAGFVVPRLPSARKTALQAQEEAALAQRKLGRMNVGLARLQGLANTAALNEADLDALVAQTEEELRQISGTSARLVQEADRLAAQHGLPEPGLQPLSANVAGVRRAASEFESSVQANDALLRAAIADARTAVATDAKALGVSQVLGLAEYVRAAGLLGEAEELRRQQAGKQIELLALGAEWNLARGQADHFRGLDVAPILSNLQADLAELAALREDATSGLSGLEQDVTQREQVLAEIDAEMAAVREKLLVLERAGFVAGNDASFDSYRVSYLKLSRKLRELQEQEQELRYGGRHGAVLVGTDPATAEIQGGEPVVGLIELQRRLAIALERAERSTNANMSLEKHVQYVVDSGRQAQTETARYEARLVELEAQQKTVNDEILDLTTRALAKEDEALQAANAAVRAFATAQSGAQAWMSAAQQLQRERDPQRKNERLRLLVGDLYVEQFARSAEAAARVLAGRIHVQRVTSSQSLIDAMQLFGELNPNFTFDPAPFETVLETAREAGTDTLGRACDSYSQVRSKLAGQPTEWVPLAALAAAQHLTWQLDPDLSTQVGEDQVGTYRELAQKTIADAVNGREKSPYLRLFVQFHNHLAGVAPAAPGDETDDFFGDESDEEEEDFFSDDS